MSVITTISLDDTLFAQVENLAQELKVSRSHLVAMALQAFIKRHETQKMIAAINAAYADFPDEEEAATLRAMKQYHAKLMADDPW